MSKAALEPVLEHLRRWCKCSERAGANTIERARGSAQDTPAATRLWSDDIVAPLASGAIALLDAAFLRELAHRALPLPPRQRVPESGFVSLDELRAQGPDPTGGLPIVCVSHPWLSREHPDPLGHNLRLVAQALSPFVSGGDASDGAPPRRVGVFWDFCSLHAWVPGYVQRLEREEALFREGVHAMGAFFAHARTTVFLCTALPPAYPAGYSRAYGPPANTAPYAERGWCAAEQAMARLLKSNLRVLDLDALPAAGSTSTSHLDTLVECSSDAPRPPPQLPSSFECELDHLAFSNGAADRPLVARLYADTFDATMARAQRLAYGGRSWGDAEAAAIAAIIARGKVPALEVLDMRRNQIGEKGGAAIAQALATGGAPQLHTLVLSLNTLASSFCFELASALRADALPLLEVVELDDNPIGDDGCAALAGLVFSGHEASSLRVISMLGTRVSQQGRAALREALESNQSRRRAAAHMRAETPGRRPGLQDLFHMK